MKRFLLTLVGFGLGSNTASAVTLEEAVAAAEERSSLVGMSEQQRVQANAQRMRARFALLPSVWFDGSYTLNQREILMDTSEWFPEEFSSYIPADLEPTVIQEKEYFSASVRVDQAIFDARTLPGLRAANEGLAASEAQLERAKRLLKAQVAQVAYQTQAAREATELATRGVTMAQAQLDLAEARRDLGGAVDREVLQAKLSLSQAIRERRGAQQAENEAELVLSQMTGFERDVSLELNAEVSLPGSLSDALGAARTNRKDLQAAKAMEASAFAVHQAARWSFMPRVNASFLTNYSENTMFSDYNTNWMGIVTAQWALWDGGHSRANKAQDRANWRMSQMARQDSSDQVELEVESAWGGLQRARQAHQHVEQEVVLARENLRLAEAALDGGGASWLEVEQARLGFQAASMAELMERTSLRLAEVAVLVATGSY